MNDDDKLLGALDDALKAGNMQAAEEIGLMLKQSRMRSEPLPQFKIGREALPQAIRAVAAGEPKGEQVWAGIGSAPAIAGYGIGGLVGVGDPQEAQNWKTLAGATPTTQLANAGGNVAMFSALPTAAFGPAARVLAGAKELPRMGKVADMVATQAAIAAATTPGGFNERLLAAGIGAAGGAAPAVVGAMQGGRRMTTQAGKQLDLAEGLRRELGNDADNIAAALRDPSKYPTSGIGVRPTAAMLTNNPALEAMERGNRTNIGMAWTPFDAANASARWQALEDLAGTPAELAKLRAARDALTAPMREGALQATGGALKVGKGTAYADLDDLLLSLSTGANRPNKEVQTLVNYVRGELEKGVTPEQLYTVRKMLTDGIKAGPTTELSQAARAARPQRMEIIGKLDEVLDDASLGNWSKYLDQYKISSPLINSREALQKIKDKLSAGWPAGEAPATFGSRAAPLTLGRALEQYGTKQFGSKDIDQLIPQHRGLIEALRKDLQSQQNVMMPRATIGSPTAPLLADANRVNDLAGAIADAAGRSVPLVGSKVSASLKGSMERETQEALARLLQNPEMLAEELRKAAMSNKILTQSGRFGQGVSAELRSGRRE